MDRSSLFVVATAACAVAGPLAHASFNEADVTRWFGEGASEAVLIIDWNQGPQSSLAWGYRFDGSTTGWDMLTALVAADDRLTLTEHPQYAGVVGALGYDVDGDGFDMLDPDDLYFGDWDGGFWSYHINQTLGEAVSKYDAAFDFWYDEIVTVYDPPIDTVNPFESGWKSSPLGMMQRIIVDGSWDGLGAAPGFVSSDPSQPVPTPATAPLLALGCAGIVARRRRR